MFVLNKLNYNLINDMREYFKIYCRSIKKTQFVLLNECIILCCPDDKKRVQIQSHPQHTY